MGKHNPILILLLLVTLVSGQETKVKETTKIYAQPFQEESIGELREGTTVRKLQRDISKRYIKATLEFYIPIDALEDPRVAFPVGTEQIANKVMFKPLDVKKEGNRVYLRLEIKNLDLRKDFDFSAMAMVKMIGAGNNRGELNPFEGRYQDLAIIHPLRSVVAELVFDFKRSPQQVELMCKAGLGGEEVYYNLGF
jgi:hypothetical protein